MEPNYSKSFGEKRVRIHFNTTNNSIVDEIKKKSAELINICEDHKHRDPMLCALPQTAFEEAAMWAVKLATAEN